MEEENSYMKLGWDNNVENCNIPIERSIMISDEMHGGAWEALEAGYLLSDLKIEKEKAGLHGCGKWIWIQFDNVSDAVAFKLLWEK